MVSTWYVGFSVAVQTDQTGVAYNLGRRAMEEAKQTGFASTPEGTAILYYDSQGGNESATRTSAHAYQVTTVVSSDLTISSSNPVQPTPDALRTVTVTVTILSNNTTAYQVSTYFARAGI